MSNASSDLRRREADIAIRHFRPKGEDLVARLVKERSQAYLYAAPKYLQRIGQPSTVQELLERGQVVGYEDNAALSKGLAGLGLPLPDGAFPIRTDNHLVQWELCKRGLGMCMMMQEVGELEPRVARVLPELAPSFPFPTWITSHRELKTSRRIRVVFDLLAQRLAASGPNETPRS